MSLGHISAQQPPCVASIRTIETRTTEPAVPSSLVRQLQALRAAVAFFVVSSVILGIAVPFASVKPPLECHMGRFNFYSNISEDDYSQFFAVHTIGQGTFRTGASPNTECEKIHAKQMKLHPLLTTSRRRMSLACPRCIQEYGATSPECDPATINSPCYSPPLPPLHIGIDDRFYTDYSDQSCTVPKDGDKCASICADRVCLFEWKKSSYWTPINYADDETPDCDATFCQPPPSPPSPPSPPPLPPSPPLLPPLPTYR